MRKLKKKNNLTFDTIEKFGDGIPCACTYSCACFYGCIVNCTGTNYDQSVLEDGKQASTYAGSQYADEAADDYSHL